MMNKFKYVKTVLDTFIEGEERNLNYWTELMHDSSDPFIVTIAKAKRNSSREHLHSLKTLQEFVNDTLMERIDGK